MENLDLPIAGTAAWEMSSSETVRPSALGCSLSEPGNVQRGEGLADILFSCVDGNFEDFGRLEHFISNSKQVSEGEGCRVLDEMRIFMDQSPEAFLNVADKQSSVLQSARSHGEMLET
jgi:hypothetical protein